MVKSMEQAAAIQSRRVAAGKKGHTRAVRRYFHRLTKDWYGVNEMKQSVPYIDPFPSKDN